MTSPAVVSVDVELFEQTPASRAADGTAPSGVGIEGCQYLRDCFAEYDATATCFVVSELAERCPDEITAFADAGHEIGSHTHTHRHLSEIPPDQRHEELTRSREILRDLTGTAVRGFRAPSFDVAGDHFETVAGAGYDYDSSVVASRRIPGWYGGEFDLRWPAPATDVREDAPASLMELPVAVMPGLRLPLTGTWIRFFGPRYTILGMKLLARRGIAPVLYFHPWEFVDLPAVDGIPKRVYYHTGDWLRRALERILAQPFEFVTAGSVVDDASGGAGGGGQ